MDKVTREQKRRRMVDNINVAISKREIIDDIDRAILADYAPLTEERRVELEWRRWHLEIGPAMFPPGTEHHEMCKKWLAEIGAELEGE